MAAEQDGNRADDDAVWQELVARLERADHDGETGDGNSQRNGPATGSGIGSASEAESRDPGPAGPASLSESVSEEPPRAHPPAPRELSAAERVRQIFDAQPRFSTNGPRDYQAPAEPVDEAYHPQDLPPLGTGEPLVVLSWVAAAGGPIALLVFSIFWQDAPRALTAGIIIAFLAGVTYLISRLPSHRDHSDGDGAAV